MSGTREPHVGLSSLRNENFRIRLGNAKVNRLDELLGFGVDIPISKAGGFNNFDTQLDKSTGGETDCILTGSPNLGGDQTLFVRPNRKSTDSSGTCSASV